MKLVDIEINVLYTMSIAMDRLLMDFERNFAAEGGLMKRDRKAAYNKIISSIKDAYKSFEKLKEDVEHESSRDGYKTLDVWDEIGLEYVRLLLLYDEKCGESLANRDAIFRALRGMTGREVLKEENLSRFYLKK